MEAEIPVVIELPFTNLPRRAWAWSASRSLDYCAPENAVDATSVCLEGHSRCGEAAVVESDGHPPGPQWPTILDFPARYRN